ncbi:mechanosensitive ion channel domain-containing protein [Aureimonas mangrovi]|uniref:mechanosensitive ion channel domain-containing protein n=1 Tax=Aureimonas mangrovi TaxID=2758041 RepID=UPI00163D9AF2|nr:mechanosensitive ion channel domain-containing protein [Aureimonas mangrovi]
MTFKAPLRFLAAVLFTVLFAAPAMAQVPGLPGAGSSVPAAEEPAAPSAEERSTLDDLIRILETPETRDRLIESLRSLAYQPSASEAGGEAGASVEMEIGESVPAALAASTRATIGAVTSLVEQGVGVVEDGADLLSGAGTINVPRVYDAILPVFSVAVAVFAVYFALAFLQRPLLDWIAGRARPGMPLRRLGLLILATLVSVVKIFICAIAGHIAAIVFYAGPPNFEQALFLNAFFITSMIQITLSAFVAPYHPALRMTPFGDNQARYWYGRLAFIIILLGYSFLFIAPIVETASSEGAANAVRFVAVTIAYLTLVFYIIFNRKRVAERLQRRHKAGEDGFQARVNALLGAVWAPLAFAFVTALYGLWLSSPQDGFRFMLVASLHSLAAIVVGGLIITLLTRLIARGIKVPAKTRERLPLLERRINGFVPRLLFALRTIVIVCVFMELLAAWSIFDYGQWILSQNGQRMLGGAFSAFVILVVGFTLYVLVSSWVEYRLNPNFGTVPAARERTLLSLFRNAFTVILGVIVMMLVLSQIGIDIAPLLAGAGVVGLAVGFGAQKLVQDIITGAFIQVENVMNEGDVVQVGATSGVVEKLTIRSVSLRSLDGTYHLIPFSSVDQVSNMTKDFSNYVADVEVAYREDTDEVRAAMEEAYDRLRATDQGENILGDFEFLGVETLGASSILVRGRVRTLPGKQWGVGRVYKALIKKVLDERRIEIPFPQTTIWFGTGKDGSAPPLRMLQASEDAQHAEIARSVPKPKIASAAATSVDDAEGADREEAAEKAEEERSQDEEETRRI